MRGIETVVLRVSVAAVAAVTIVAGCAAPVTSPTVPAATSSAAVPASTTPATPPVSPSPSAESLLDVASLPAATLDPATLTALCDPVPSQTNPTAGESQIGCADGLLLGLRAIKTLAVGPIPRLYLRREPCPTRPCSADILDTAIVTAWTPTRPMSVSLDSPPPAAYTSPAITVTVPVADPAAAWPAAPSAVGPPTQRPVITGAPAEVTERVPYPFCGNEDLAGGLNAAAEACFFAAVIAGRPAEFIEHVYGTEGGSITWLYRFAGHGAPIRYEADGHTWFRQAGGLVLGPTGTAVDFDIWDGTYQLVR